MNIKNRLEKLEKEIGASRDGNEFCQCFDKDIAASINEAYGEPYNKADLLPEGAVVGDHCERCGKPVENRIREFYRDVNESYGDVSLSN